MPPSFSMTNTQPDSTSCRLYYATQAIADDQFDFEYLQDIGPATFVDDYGNNETFHLDLPLSTVTAFAAQQCGQLLTSFVRLGLIIFDDNPIKAHTKIVKS